MPRVPTYDNFQAAPSPQPNVQLRATQVADVTGQQTQQIAQGLQNTGAAVGRIAIDMQTEANQIRVDDAINRAKEAALKLTYDKDAGFTNQRGLTALERPSGKPLADEYSDTLKDQISQITQGLGNDAQKQLFSRHANDLLTSFRGQAVRHESDQFREYTMSVREGTIATRTNEIALNYNNPQVIDEALTSIKAAAYDQARLLGKSAEWAEANARKVTSNAHKVALGAALEQNNIGYADAYLKKYAGDMEADDILRAKGLITKELDAQLALGTANAVMQSVAPRIVTSDADRAFNIATRGADTTPETRASFEQNLKDFGGNLPQAYAAMASSPEQVKQAVVKAKSQGGEWLAYLPKGVQSQVSQGLASYNAGEGQFPKPTLSDVHAAIRERLGASNPSRLNMALAEASRQWEDQQKAIKQREDENVANAMRAVQQNGGRFSELPIAIRAGIPPKEVDNVMNFAARIAKGDDVTNPAVYQKLASDPAYLKSLSDNEFFRLRPQLNETDFKHFANERGAATKTGGANAAEDLNTPAINDVLNDRLRTLGIDPTPKDGSPDAMRVGAMRKFVRDSLLNAQSVAGKKMSDAEVEKHVDGLFAKSQEFQTSFLGFSTGTSSKRMLDMQVRDIPSDVRDRLKKDFKAAGIAEPTDADLLGAYWRLKGLTNK